MSQGATPSSNTDLPRLPSEAAAAASEQPCPECGEKVRSGMVRCWNCGAFLRKEIADRYAEMQSKPQPIILSEMPADEAVAVGDVDDEDGGFELRIIEAKSLDSLAHGDSGGGYALRQEPAAESKPAAPESRPAPKAAPAPKADAGPKAEAAPKDEAAADDDNGVSHSVATAGDVLLQVALKEQAEERQRRKERGVSLRGGARTPGGFVIYCPYGCRIEVKDQHRGMTGACPKCRAPFIVPIDPPDYDYKERAAAAAKVEAATSPTGKWVPWMTDLHLHQVAPERLKLKPGSLQKDFIEVDVGFSDEGLLMVSLASKKAGAGRFGGVTDKKKPDNRAALHLHLKDGKPASEAPAADVRLYKPEELSQLRVAQPAANPVESMFVGVPVFGDKQIAVQLPLGEGEAPRFLSFGLIGFRAFAKALQEQFAGMPLIASGVPMDDVYTDYKCHYTDVPIRALQNVEWYQADPTAGVTLAGWKCAACGLAISEDARKKENIGGKAGKGIAKAKCPKCTNKFGEQPLYTLPSQLTTAAMGEGATT